MDPAGLAFRKMSTSHQSQLARKEPHPKVTRSLKRGRGVCWLSSQHKEIPHKRQKTPHRLVGCDGILLSQSKNSASHSEIAATGMGDPKLRFLVMLTGAFHSDMEPPELLPVQHSSPAQTSSNRCCESGRAPSEESSSLPVILLSPSAKA